MASKNILNGNHKYIGFVEHTNGGDHGTAYSADGKVVGTYVKLANMTYRNGAGPFGSGDLLEALVHTYAAEKGW